MENIQGPEHECGQVPTYYIFVTITQNKHNIAEQLPLSYLGEFKWLHFLSFVYRKYVNKMIFKASHARVPYIIVLR